MSRVWAIAANTFREAVRDRVLYLLLFFGLLLIVSSVVLSLLTVGSEEKIITDVGLAGISLFGVLISVFVGIDLVSREIQRRTVQTVITKPLYRYQFLLGKYLGLLLTILCNVAAMTAMLLLVLALRGFRPAGTLILAVLLIYAELALITAFALLFSTFSTPMLSALFTLAVYFTGHVTEGLMLLKARLQAPASRLLCDVLYYLLPNLENFDLKHQAVHGLPLGEGRVLLALVYGLLYSGAVFFLAVAVFRRRDLP